MKKQKHFIKEMALFQIVIALIGIISFTELISAGPIEERLAAQYAASLVAPKAASFTANFGVDFVKDIGKGLVEGGKSLFNLQSAGDLLNNGLGWSAGVWIATFGIFWVFSGGNTETALFAANALGSSFAVGTLTYSLTTGIAEGFGFAASTSWVPVVGWVLGGTAALITLWQMTMVMDQRGVVFDCQPWQAKTGGSDCEKCNDKDFTCTLYQCKSLGQSCELVNEGPNARCIAKNQDPYAPKVTARNDSLLDNRYSYTPLAGAAANGVEIKYTPAGGTPGCLPAYQRFTFGVELDKTGICKLENKRTDKFDSMTLPFGTGLPAINHTQLMFFPGQTGEGAQLPTAGNYEYYVRCQNTNGVANDAEFLFKFCIDNFPDTMPPEIYSFNFKDKTPIKWFAENENAETTVKLYTNELSTCKWSHTDKAYDLMENSLTCPSSKTNVNAQMSYTCSGTLTGLQNEVENKFYFRCNDTKGNVNPVSKNLTLIGSRPLLLSLTSPTEDEVVKGASTSVKVTLKATTSAGYDNGIATCYWSTTGVDGTYTNAFDVTRSYTHSHDLYLPKGSYTYFVRCFDMAGNYKVNKTNFEVESDKEAPVATRVYNEGTQLKILTNEEAECVYDNVDCEYNFEEGMKMTSLDKLNHYTDLANKNKFFIKCRDNYGTGPSPNNQCTVIVHPFRYSQQ